MITTAVLTSVPVLAGALFLVGVIKGWVRLGSALFGAACMAIISSSALFGQWLTTRVDQGVTWGGSELNELGQQVEILGFRPADHVPSWGWPLIFGSLVVALMLVPLVVGLDRPGTKAKKSSS